MKTVEEILEKIDSLHRESKLEEAEKYMISELSEARKENAWTICLTILNEMAGHYRDRGMMKKALDAGLEAESILDANNVPKTKERAANYLNIANIYRAMHELDDSFLYYKKALTVIEISGDPSIYSSYYNNLALLHQEAGKFEEAVSCLKKALEIAEDKLGDEIRVAISRTNLATSLIRMKRLDEAYEYLKPAVEIFAGRTPSDFHYSAALSAMADLSLYRGEADKAVDYFEAALSEIELHMGKNNFYEIVLDNLEKAKEIAGSQETLSGLELSEKYFKTFALPVIKKNFSHIEKHIACGLFGEGSECLGFDDETSKDHDYGPGFIIVCDDEVSDNDFTALEQMYSCLPKTYMGIRRIETVEAAGRVGVIRFKDLLKKYIGMNHLPKANEEWATINDEMSILMTNGKLFMDKGAFLGNARTYLEFSEPYYIFFNKVAFQLELMAKHGQYGYKRAFNRGDAVAALCSKAEFVKAFLRLVHLLCRVKAPYDKWLYKSADKLVKSKRKRALYLEKEINKAQLISSRGICPEDIDVMEEISKKVNDLLISMGICRNKEEFLQIKAYELKVLAANTIIADKIVDLEWALFDKTKNEGGRADCQDNWSTFSVMRRSQYYCWPRELLTLLLADYTDACNNGRNVITEKYAYMMESTAPEEFNKIKDKLPEIDNDKKNVIDAIVSIQVKWREEFAKEYPDLSDSARVIHTSEDTPFVTSYETYLRGELSTYHPDTLTEYGKFIAYNANNNINLTKYIMNFTTFFYGYSSLDDI